MAAIGLVGSAVSAVGSASAAGSQAGVESYNALVHRLNAITERQRGVHEADAKEDEYERLRNRQRAAAAANGVRVDVGSAAQIADEASGRDQYMDEVALIWNAESSAKSQEQQANVSDARAKAIRKGAGLSLLTGLTKGVATVIR